MKHINYCGVCVLCVVVMFPLLQSSRTCLKVVSLPPCWVKWEVQKKINSFL